MLSKSRKIAGSDLREFYRRGKSYAQFLVVNSTALVVLSFFVVEIVTSSSIEFLYIRSVRMKVTTETKKIDTRMPS